ncbi:MAG TPA: DUF5916 domain-containing protein [Bacteroidales bacterium]|nr:DUF5916 domain-containing protein [Bacteroidales bacterium]
MHLQKGLFKKSSGIQILFTILCLFTIVELSFGMDDSLKSCKAIYFPEAKINLDGQEDEKEWKETIACGNFIQQRPYEKVLPSQLTEFKVIYDDEYIYFMIQAYDSMPKKIVRRLARRDDIQGDWVGIQIDTYNDRTTAFTFFISAAGVKFDGIQSETDNTGDPDPTWDAIWEAKTIVHEKGWSVEMKISLSQLRFDKNNSEGWGLQVIRNIHRNEEMSLWQYIPRNAPGWVRYFGRLNGLDHIKRVPQVEIAPYVAIQHETYKKEEENPYRPGKNTIFRAGIDGKVSLASNVILDYTINPDFGQVEADPSVVNLTAFETYFTEKRPFFIEGKNILNFQITPGDNSFSGDNLFYSRRIGRKPKYIPDADYVDMPEATPILAAFKLTGKTKDGWSFGVLESMTDKTSAKITKGSEETSVICEPFSNYFVGRILKDYHQGESRIGGMITSVYHDHSEGNPSLLSTWATTGGLDFYYSWKKQTYFLDIKAIASYVNGTKEAISKLQQSPIRNFQRPDATYLKFDTLRTSLSGHGGSIHFGRQGNSSWKYSVFITWRSPGLEINDIGYLHQADNIFQVAWIGYQKYHPFLIFRSAGLNLNQWSGWDFGMNSLFKGGNINAWAQFKNYWQISAGLNFDGNNLDNYILRGGPALKLPGGYSYWGYLSTDTRKKLLAEFNTSFYQSFTPNFDYSSVEIGMTYHPITAMSFGLYPEYSVNNDNLQYVAEKEMNGKPRYIMAHIHQKTLALQMRVNLNLSNDLSLQYYGQPFISSGEYSRFKFIASPKANDYYQRFTEYSEAQLFYQPSDKTYQIDENYDGITDYTFNKPDFKALYFVSNLVLRWEYFPGSFIYVVWSQNRAEQGAEIRFKPTKDISSLFDIYPENIFMVKISYLIQYQHLKRIF